MKTATEHGCVSALDRPLIITFFPNFAACNKREEVLSLRAFLPLILNTSQTEKAKLPWFKAAGFGDKRKHKDNTPVEKQSLRNNDNLLAISGVEGDYDSGVVTIDDALDVLRRNGIAGMIYTSPSHTEDAPRWRVLCPLSHDMAPDARTGLVERLNGLFHGALAGESFTLSQSYYFGSVKQNPSHRVELVDGDFIDERLDLDEGKIGKPRAVSALPSTPQAPRSENNSRYVEAIIRNALNKVSAAGEGQKHAVLRSQAILLGGIRHAGKFSDSEAVGWLLDALPASAKDRKAAEVTARWGVENGAARPIVIEDRPARQSRAPEPPQAEDDGPAGDWTDQDEPQPANDDPGYHEAGQPDGNDIKIELPPNFSVVRNKGVFHHSVRVVDGEKKPTSEWVCAPLYVTAETQDETNNNWGLLLEWNDRDGKAHKWSMPRKMLHDGANTIAAELEDAGLSVGTDQRAHNLLKQFLSGTSINRRIRCVGRTGWHTVNDGHVYVLSDTESFGPSAKGVILQSDRIAAARPVPETCGTLEDWQDQIARYAVKNYRIGLFLAAAFSGPLLEITAEPSGGLHLHGGSQSGKTTALRVAGSVWGQATTKGVIKTWRATANGLEGVAAKATDGLLLLDEIGQANADEVGDIIYQLGNDAGKARAARDGSARASMTWRLAYLSTGEKTVATKMGERGNTVHAGQDVRLVNIPSDAGAGMGVYHDLHGFTDGAALSTHLCRATEITAYGTAARAFLDRLAKDRATDPNGLVSLIAARREAFLGKVLPAGADGQVISVARRFSLIAVAGELATTYGILPWPETEAFNAAGMGFKAWLAARGGTGAAEDRQAVLTVRRFLEQHEESRFRLLVNNSERQSSEGEIRAGREINNRVGFRREVAGGWEFLIFPESWKEDVCKGLDPARAASALNQSGFLDKGDGKNWAKKQRVPGVGLGRFYTVGRILGDDD